MESDIINSMKIIDGKALAEKMQEELKNRVIKLKEQGIQPGLAVILIGENPASQVYVRNKERVAAKLGFKSEVIRLPETTSEADLLALIESFNKDQLWHGILVQLPLPSHISEEKSYLQSLLKKM